MVPAGALAPMATRTQACIVLTPLPALKYIEHMCLSAARQSLQPLLTLLVALLCIQAIVSLLCADARHVFPMQVIAFGPITGVVASGILYGIPTNHGLVIGNRLKKAATWVRSLAHSAFHLARISL